MVAIVGNISSNMVAVVAAASAVVTPSAEKVLELVRTSGEEGGATTTAARCSFYAISFGHMHDSQVFPSLTVATMNSFFADGCHHEFLLR
jgi:hypothetical protein